MRKEGEDDEGRVILRRRIQLGKSGLGYCLVSFPDRLTQNHVQHKRFMQSGSDL